jgi:Asp-tRNA(Asn)/Glu-tRNA(Gln) amidotransferase A subunit family amidase
MLEGLEADAVLEESALEQAKRAEQAVMRKDALGPLHGVPLALKDCFAIRGVRTTGGSKLLAENIADHDCTVVERLRNAGGVFLGTLNMHEFARGATTANQYYGIARNPWKRDRIPGGSSGGSAIAVAASLRLGSMGTDAGGSVRLPAALCWIVGLKPTYGRISRYGTLPLSLSPDHSGPMTRSPGTAISLQLESALGRGRHHVVELLFPALPKSDARCRSRELPRPSATPPAGQAAGGVGSRPPIAAGACESSSPASAAGSRSHICPPTLRNSTRWSTYGAIRGIMNCPTSARAISLSSAITPVGRCGECAGGPPW